MQEWGRTDLIYSRRITNLRTAGCSPRTRCSTIGTVDSLTGGTPDLDWFFGQSAEVKDRQRVGRRKSSIEATSRERGRSLALVGHVDSMHNRGCIYENGPGVEKDVAEALAWYRKAADKGDEASATKPRELEPPQAG